MQCRWQLLTFDETQELHQYTQFIQHFRLEWVKLAASTVFSHFFFRFLNLFWVDREIGYASNFKNRYLCLSIC
jgi:hypothetical protein